MNFNGNSFPKIRYDTSGESQQLISILHHFIPGCTEGDKRLSLKGIGTLRQVLRESRLVKHFSKVEDTKTVVLAWLKPHRYKSHAFSLPQHRAKPKYALKRNRMQPTQHIIRKEHVATNKVRTETHVVKEGTTLKQKTAAHGNTHKRQCVEHTPCCSLVDEMFNSLLTSHTGNLLACSCVGVELHLYLQEAVLMDYTGGDRMKGALSYLQNKKVSLFTTLISPNVHVSHNI